MNSVTAHVSVGKTGGVLLPHIQQRGGSWMEEASCEQKRRVLLLALKTRADGSGNTTGPLKKGNEDQE